MTDEDDSEVLRQIQEQEDALYRALEFSDGDAFLEILSEDAMYIHSTGVAETREEAAAGQRHGVFKHGANVTVERNTRVFGDAVVTRGIIDMLDTAHGEPLPMRLRQTLIWIKEDGVWKMLLRQATRIPI